MNEPTRDIFDLAVIEVAGDLARELRAEQRFHRLLTVLRRVLQCDAAAILQLRDAVLEPLAVSGLSAEAVGRRFALAEQPRLQSVVLTRQITRFTEAELPDPYDGLFEGGVSPVAAHDCIGAPLCVDGELWGVLTLDAQTPGVFERLDPGMLRTFIALTEAAVSRVQTVQQLRAQIEHEHLIGQALLAGNTERELIGSSAVMQTVRRELAMVAGSDLVVLILGETGVGKEIVAQQIHAHSPRCRQPMVYVNCAALPETLAESELFGHSKGAFTGAASDRKGKFELAHGGTLLLDEVGELPLSIQAKLLRVMQSGEIQRLGCNQTVRVDVRVLAATNRDLKFEVAAGRFRADLYHRLSVFPLLVPPLRERGRDVLELAGYFLGSNQRRLQARNLCFTAAAREMLLAYAWPGNVRELEHVVSRAALLATAEQGRNQRWVSIDAPHLGLLQTAPREVAAVSLQSSCAPLSSMTLADAVDAFKRDWLQRILQECDANLAAAARIAGIDRSNFSRLLKRLGLR